MSIEAAREFLLQAEGRSEMEKLISQEEFEEVKRIATDLGYEFEAQELARAVRETILEDGDDNLDFELDLDSLNIVAGGAVTCIVANLHDRR